MLYNSISFLSFLIRDRFFAKVVARSLVVEGLYNVTVPMDILPRRLSGERIGLMKRWL